MNSSHKSQELQQTLKYLKKNIDSITKQIDELSDERRKLQEKYDELKSQLKTVRVQEISNSLSTTSSEYGSEAIFPWTSEVNRVRREIFQISEFRPLQITAINALLDGRDVILVMPTGAGKSLVYQLPALLNISAFKVNGRQPGSVTLVISPLVSLMVDQSINLTRYCLEPDTIATLDANTPLPEQRRILSLLAEKSSKANTPSSSKLRLLYVTPEKLAKSKLLLNRLEIAYSTNRLACIAIDEVHCASQWGHDFRPDYKFLHILRRQFPNVPIIGLTATASAEIIVDVQNMLGLSVDKCLVLRTSYNRENLNYYVKSVSGSTKASVRNLYELINKNYTNQSGIVYCFSQKDTEDVSSELKNFGLKSAPYHANLDFNYRSRVHTEWTQGQIQVIVATVAFGMGIDKADVRFVIHFSSSKSLENYYQESGRAGRDSNSADCILIWRFSDLFRLASMVSSERTGIVKLYKMVEYCIDPDKCRRYLISKNLGDASWSSDDCRNACDNCRRKSTNKSDTSSLIQIETAELLNTTRQILFDQCLTKHERITGPKLIDLMISNKQLQSISQKLLNEIQTTLQRQFYEHFISWCLIKQYLKLDFHFTPYSTVCYVVTNDSSVDDEHNEAMPYLLSRKNYLDESEVTKEGYSTSAKRQRIHTTERIDLT
ncbi:hypothetical protein MN116_006396 [Schistosoma mekongi]|uniref:ATP-dependent DNA helicase n=1 Tax=Schistosoma mekongi TaxID=38744 RepID=A0AAE1ZBI9_SCHME|nr:hypothetical protein MN116_006396 [Schistosoma mekongi]